MSWEAIVWYLLLVDSVIAIVLSFCCAKWLKKNYKGLWKHFPITKGWSIYYFVLVLIIGWLLYRLRLLMY